MSSKKVPTLAELLKREISKKGISSSRAHLAYREKRPLVERKNYESIERFLTFPYVAENLQEAQIKINQEFKYVLESDILYGNIGDDQYPSLPSILSKMSGCCKEGFILAASVLKHFGYKNIRGIFVAPTDGQDYGHIVAAYQDPGNKLWGLVGHCSSDFSFPLFKNITSLGRHVAKSNNYNTAELYTVEFDDRIITSEKPIKLRERKVDEINLMAENRSKYFEVEHPSGKFEISMFDDGFRIKWSGLLPMDDSAGEKIKNMTYTFFNRNYESLGMDMEDVSGNRNLVFTKYLNGNNSVIVSQDSNKNIERLEETFQWFDLDFIDENPQKIKTFSRLYDKYLKFMGVEYISGIYSEFLRKLGAGDTT